MCGRYTLSDTGDLIQELAVAEPGGDSEFLKPRFNIAPTQAVAAVRQDVEGRWLGALHWGLVPFWAKDKSIGNRMINARSETAAKKPAFRNAWKKRRCLILTDGFYEWKKIDGGKQPFYIHLEDRRPFVFAGLWESWTDKSVSEEDEATPAEPTVLESCTILTTSANQDIEPLHHRMPVILEGEARDRWLDPDSDPDSLHSIVGPAPTGLLSYLPVSRLVNNPRNDVARCLEPVQL